MKIAVVYLSWLPYGKEYLINFLNNYSTFSAGYDHTLVIAFNGVKLVSRNELAEFEKLLSTKNIRNYKVLYFEQGQDIDVYQQVAGLIDSEYCLFLNTYSKFLSSNWLKLYIDNLNEKTGIIGATGSHASYISSVRELTRYAFKSDVSFGDKFNKLKYLIKMYLFESSHFKSFPAPHVRTTGFFISRALFVEVGTFEVKNKMQAYYCENGRDSLTVRVKRKGLECLLIDKFGNIYAEDAWQKSNTFWNGKQENLLISDNQTEKYMEASLEEKMLYRKIAWGI